MNAYFDIETGPLLSEQLDKVRPEFKAPANYRDTAKIAASIAEQEAAWKERAALSAESGMVLCVGLWTRVGFTAIDYNDEAILVNDFWLWLDGRLSTSEPVIGFNIFGFDLPFLLRRSWVLGVTVPKIIRGGRYWNENFIDLMQTWSCGNRDQTISLDRLARYLGVGSKNGSGADFAALWASDKDKALEYLENDLNLTKLCAERMGI